MTPEFAAAIDPVFLHVLGVLERIQRGDSPPAREERQTVLNHLRSAESQVGQRTEWMLAKYALVAWIDEVLTEAPWSSREWWENNSLEFELFNTHVRATQFYIKGKEASALTRRDALEVYFLCVVLGFRGLYGNPQSAAFESNQLQLPPDLEGWARHTARSIQLGQGRPPIDEKARERECAPPLEGRYQLFGAVIVFLVLLVISAVVAWFAFVE